MFPVQAVVHRNMSFIYKHKIKGIDSQSLLLPLLPLTLFKSSEESAICLNSSKTNLGAHLWFIHPRTTESGAEIYFS